MQEWLNKLKIAIAEEDIDAIAKLFDGNFQSASADKLAKTFQNASKLPQVFQSASTDELSQAAALTKEAIKLVESKKNALAPTLKKIQTAKEFFRA